MSSSVIENIVAQENISPESAEQVVKNADAYKSTTAQEAALFDLNINTQKENHGLSNLPGWDLWIANPYRASEFRSAETERLRGLYELSKQPLYQSLAQKYGQSLAYKTDIVLGHTRQTGWAPYRAYSSITNNLNQMRVSDYENRLSKARTVGDTEEVAKLEEELAHYKFRAAYGPQPFESEGWNSASAFVASMVRNPEVLVLSALAGAAVTAGAPLLAGAGLSAGAASGVSFGTATALQTTALADIYADTKDLTMGQIVPQIMEENPGMTEEEARNIASDPATFAGIVEVFTSALGLSVRGGSMVGSSRLGAKLATRLGLQKTGTQAIRDMPEFARNYLRSQMPKKFSDYAKEYGGEVLGNTMEEFLQQAAEETALRQAKTGESFSEAYANRLIEFAQNPEAPENAELLKTIRNTLFGAGVVSGVMNAPGGLRTLSKNRTPTLLQRSNQATNNMSFAQQLFDWRQKNPVAKESPETDAAHSQALVDRGIAPKNVRIDRKTAMEVLKDPNMQEAVKELELDKAVAESEENGGVIEVDFVKYDAVVNNNKELFQRVSSGISFIENALTVNEFIEHLNSLDSEALSEIKKAKEKTDSVYNQVYEQQMQMEGMDEKVARTNAITAQLISNRIGAFKVGQALTGEQVFKGIEIRPMTEEEAASGKTLDNLKQSVNIQEQTGQEPKQIGATNEQRIESGTATAEPTGIIGRIRQNIRQGNDGNVWVDTGTSNKTARGSKGKRVLSYTPEAAKELNNENYSTPKYTVYTNPAQGAKEFLSAMEKAVAELGEYAASVDVKELNDYKDMKALILSEDKKTGCAVTKDGDIVSLFSSSPERGRAVPMLLLAVQNGGKKLDCFDIYLPKLYAKAGFKAVARNHWNEEYKPDGWNKELFDGYNHGEPDVVFMVYDASGQEQEYKVGDGVLIEGEDAYDKGMEAQDKALAQQEKGPLFQKAYAGSRTDYDRPSLTAIGSGEGGQAHGWGLYYALDPIVADFYRQKFTSDYRYRVDYNGKEINRDYETSDNAIENVLWDMHVAIDNISGMSETEKARKAKEKLTKSLKESIAYEENSLKTEQNERLIKYLETDLKRNKEKLEALNKIDPDLINEHKWGQVHEVDVPEMDVLLDEQKDFDEQSDFVKQALSKVFRDLSEESVNKLKENELYSIKSKEDLQDLSGADGEEIYNILSYALGSAKSASQMLEKYGLKGITYEGTEDGRCFVIFNDKDVKVLRKKFDELGRQLFQKEEDRVAGVFRVEDGKLVIGLTPNANPSTLSHEMFHWFSHEMQKAFNSGEMTDYWKKQVKNLARTVGAKIEDGKLTLTEAQEEKAANMFLLYIKEGKVQNREIAPLFSYMQELFHKIWGALKISGKLSKQSEELFDSIFRAQDLIEHEQRMAGLLPIEKPEGVDQGLYDMYVGEMLTSRMKATQELVRKREGLKKFMASKQYEALRDTVKASITKTLSNNVEYRIKEIAAQNNNDPLQTFMTIQENPELAQLDLPVEQIEYILKNTPDLSEAVEQETERQMLDTLQRRSRLTPEQIGYDETRNTAKVRALLAEALMRGGKTIKDFETEYQKILNAADRQINKTEVRKLKKDSYWAGLETKIVEDYIVALGKKNNNAMARARRDQAVVNAIRIKAKAISNRFDRFVDVAQRFEGAQQKVVHENDKGKSVSEYKYTAEAYDLMQSILEKFGFYVKYARRSPRPVGEKLYNWVDNQEATTMTKLGVLKNYVSFINEGYSGELDQMTGGQFDKLSIVFDAVKSVAGGEYSVMLKSEQVFFSDMVEATRENFKSKGLEAFQKPDNWWTRNFGTLGKWTNPEAILRAIFPPQVMDNIFLPFIDAAVRAEKEGNEWVNRYRLAKSKVDISNTLHTYSTGHTLSNKEVADLLLSMGNQHAYDNFRISLRNLTEEEAETIVSEALKAQPELANFAKEVWATYDKAREYLETEFETRTNTLFIKKDHRSFTINGIEFGGGYVPARKSYDFIPTDARAKNIGGMVHDKKFEKNIYAEADGNVLSIVDITENELYQSAKQGLTAVEYNNVQKFLKQDGVKDTIGSGAFDFITDWLTVYQAPYVDTSAWIRPLAQLSTTAALGFRAATMILQLSGVFQAATELGPTYFARGLAQAMRNGEWAPRLATRKGADKSDYMSSRINDPRSSLLGRSVVDAVRMQDAKTQAGKAAQAVTKGAGDLAMAGIQYFDTIVANITWNGAYKRALDNGKSEAEARREADSVVRVVQSDAMQISRPTVMQSQLARTVTAFSTWILAMRSQLVALTGSKQYGTAFVWATAYMVASPLFEAFLKESINMMYGDDDDDKDYLEKVRDTWYNQIVDTIGSAFIPAANLGAGATKAIAAGIELGFTDENEIFKLYQSNIPALQTAGRLMRGGQYGIAGAISGDSEKLKKAAIQASTALSSEGGKIVKMLLAD